MSVQSCYATKGLSAIIFAHVILNLPFAFYLISTAYQKVDHTLTWMAQDLGAKGRQVYRDAVWPGISASVYRSFIFIFILCFSSYSIPLLLADEIYYTPDIMMTHAWQAGEIFTAAIYLALRFCVIVTVLFFPQKKSITQTVLPRYVARKKISLRNAGLILYSFMVWLFVIAPFIFFIVQISLTELYDFFYSLNSIDIVLKISVMQAIENSSYIALLSSVIAVLLGLILCVLTFFFGEKIGKLLSAIPLVVGSLGIALIYSECASFWHYSPALAIILSHVFLNYPFTYRILATQFDAYNAELSYLAGSLGATKLKKITTVIFPFIRRAILRSWCLAFGLSLVESGAASALGGEMQNTFVTIPIAMKLFLKSNQQTQLVGMSLLLLFIVIFASFIANYFFKILKNAS